MEDREKLNLAAFREVAREVRASSIVESGLAIKQWLRLVDDKPVGLDFELLPNEPFRSLCVSVRNVYMQEGPAHFYTVKRIVDRYAPEYRERAVAVRADYELVLRGNGSELRVRGKRIDHEDLFKAWLNRYTFHKDAYKDQAPAAEPYDLLKSAIGPAVDAVVQKVALQLAGCVIEMDDVIADWLGQERLPRIGPVTTGQ